MRSLAAYPSPPDFVYRSRTPLVDPRRTRMARTVADQMVEVLAAAGVKRIYGIVGDSLNGFTDALRRAGGIEWLHVRHEEVAAFGSGYFQETHPEHLFRECSSYCELVSTPAQMPRTLEVAVRRAVLERTVSVVVIPGDVALRP